ncbi:MAG TPA: sulfatase-like hydrolase/transferase, partial [Clostridia bacterium]|nr:sulfatase-like hydrolase/transferase [Clostridia bacterium]
MSTYTGQKPNIVFIMADDMGYGDAGCYGAKKIKTPNIDLLASVGMRFTDAHSSSAVCTPSRYSVLTGRYAWRTRLNKNVQCGHGLPLIENERKTVASMLRDHGYATGAFGKWHLGFKYTRKDGTFFTESQSLNDSPDNADLYYKDIDYSKPL